MITLVKYDNCPAKYQVYCEWRYKTIEVFLYKVVISVLSIAAVEHF